MNRLYWAVLVVVLSALIVLPGSVPVSGDTISQDLDVAGDSPEKVLRAALDQARQAGSYRVDIAVDQSVIPDGAPSLATAGETAHFELKGSIAGPDRARFSIAPSRTSFVLAQRDPQEFLIRDATIYQRAGVRWIKVESAPSLVGIDGDALSLASVAREVERLEAVDDPLGRLERFSFRLYADDVVRFLLLKRDQYSVENMALARLSVPAIHGSGELWVDPSGLPARLVLDLAWSEGEETPHQVRVASTADYFDFGRQFTPGFFDPAVSPQTGAPVAGLQRQGWQQPAVWLLAAGALLVWGWVLLPVRRSRRAMVIITGVLIVALLAPMLAPAIDAAGVRERISGDANDAPATPPLPGSELNKMLEETQALANKHLANSSNAANALAEMDDEDSDGLPNGYELRLGTSPFSADTDHDGLSDDEEVEGVPCTWEPLPGQPQIVYVETDPLNPDSNYDGLTDGDEYWRGECNDGYRYGYPWDDDNDNDGVPDGIDLSPFSTSLKQISKLGGLDQPGSNLTFDTLDQDPNEQRTVPYPFYVEIQVRPKNEDSLRWAYKTLTWPLDQKAAIRHDPAGGALAAIFTGKDHISTGDIELVPFLQATLREQDLPSQTARKQYGVSISAHKNDQGDPVFENGEALYDMVLPLVPVERGGQVFAFQAKMLHDRGRSLTLTRQWRDLRLKWAVIGDVLMPDDDGDYVASPDGGYGLVVYDEAYHITGLQVSRQGGASMLLAGAIPPGGRRVDLDARVALLRAGLEAQFLTGRLGFTNIVDRFDSPNSATSDERWGISQDWEYRVKHDVGMNYAHLDEAIATTTMTTTRQLLNELYIEHQGLEPTLILASEQRTSTVNLDDDPTANYLDIYINTCLKPLITSRSLKLQTYRWDPTASPTLLGGVAAASVAPLSSSVLGDWVPLSLDEVLQTLEDQLENILSPEELNILKMATTAWQVGMTAIQKIGGFDIQDVANVLSDPEMVLKFLDENGLIPSEYTKVVAVVLGVFEAGGPGAWLEQQWNKVVGVVDTVGEVLDGSFFDFSGEFSLPSEDTLLGWTNTAINALNFLAMVTGNSYFAQVARVLTKVVEIYQKLRALWDSIKASIDALQQGVSAAVNTLAQELTALSRPLSLAGLIIAIGMIWVGLGLTLQMGDYGPTITLTLVMKAIVETILLVVLFVVALIFPWGTIVAIGIGLIKFIEDLIGFSFDPVSIFLDWLFDVEPVQRTDVDGDPQIGQLKMEALEPGGGLIAGRLFRLKLPSILTMKTINGGSVTDLNQSWAELHLGRFQAAVNVPVSICTRSTEQFQDYKEALQGFIKQEFSAQNYYCVAFTLPREKYWQFSASGAYNAGSPYFAPPSAYKRDFISTGYLDIEPLPAINGKVFLDVSYDLWVRYDECSKFGCDEYVADSTTTPAIEPIYFDILPGSIKSLWEWDELLNRDPDGDGLWGYLDPQSNQLKGPDANLCPALPGPKSWERWDRDSDGLSDKFELETAGFNPCDDDTDGDGLLDWRELIVGTEPNHPDTDGDGLTDDEELVVGEQTYGGVTEVKYPWRVALSSDYSSLPDPAAFPNPRQANLDRDHRNDKKERTKQTSPNAFNPIPVGEPLDLWINQTLTTGGGTSVTINTPPWVNDEAFAASPVLTVTLPVAFSDLTRSAKLLPSVQWQAFNEGTLQPSGVPNAHQWSLPPIWLNRYLGATLAGKPDIPSGPVTVTAQLSYVEGGVPQVSTAAVPLKVNTGGPGTAFVGVEGAVPLGGFEQTAVSEPPVTSGPVTIQGMAKDPEGVSAVYVCVKTSDTCGAGDWMQASSAVGLVGSSVWSYDFNPSSDAVYYARAYAVDNYSVAGPISDAATFGVDRTPPAGARFDLQSTAYLSSTAGLGALSIISLTGQVSDTTGAAYVSGVGSVSVLGGDGELLDTVSPAQPGESSSPFIYGWEVHSGGSGGTMEKPAEPFTLTLGARDVAGNITGVPDTLHVVVDDTSPAVYGRPPQTLVGTTLTLSGLADDTALLNRRQLNQPYKTGTTMDDRDTRFDVNAEGGRALIVSDVTGDLIDDVVLLVPASPAGIPFQAGLFFGRPGGLPDILTLSDADVIFRGELPADLFDFDPAAAGAGDVNGDGIGDLLLGDPSTDNGAGRAYLVLGRRDFGSGVTFDLVNADWRLSVARTVGFGGSVSAAGDVNGDGLADLMVGAATDGVDDGVSWLYLGREQGVGTPVARFYGPAGSGFFPPNLAGLGDTNGDGLSDLLIASEGAGVALVYGRPEDAWPAGAADLGGLADATFAVPGNWQNVAAAGDVNGDGLADMLIGDPEFEPPRVFLLYGRRPEDPWAAPGTDVNLVAEADASFVESGEPRSRLGAGLTALGDIDRDGRDDFAFGQPGLPIEVNRTALVGTDQTSLALDMSVAAATYLISGTAAIQESGVYLSSGDVNGDHIRDLLIGAGGDNRAYLFNGDFDPGIVSGIAEVQIGVFGPVTDATIPLTMTLPTAWRTATLANGNGAISPWAGQVVVPVDGDYRVYARARDRAANRLPAIHWYLGDVWVNGAPMPLSGAGTTLNAPTLTDQTGLGLTGTITNAMHIQHLRVYNGYEWQRMQPFTGTWSLHSTIPHSDLRTLTFRSVARDAFGATLTVSRTLTVDTLIGGPPQLTANLSLGQWQTDISPTLVISWSAPTDASGITGVWATIDTISNTVPTTAAGSSPMTDNLDAPGVYYGHMRVQDGAGNTYATHTGPFPVNRSRTPSVVLVDGYLDFAGGEYPDGTLLNYDPYAAIKPAALWGTWDADRLFLGFPGNQWGGDSVFSVYVDTQPGGLNQTLTFSHTHSLPFAADYALVLGGPSTAQTLYAAGPSDWSVVPSPQSRAVGRLNTEIVLDRAEISASGAVAMLAYAENGDGVWAVLPGGARPTITETVSGPVLFQDSLSWAGLIDGVAPGAGQDQIIAPRVTINPPRDNTLSSGQTTAFTVTVTNPSIAPYVDEPLTIQTDPLMTLTGVNGATCISCPVAGNEWKLGASVAPGATQTITLGSQASSSPVTGVLPMTITARLDNSGLPTMPQAPARALYVLDRGQAAVGFLKPGRVLYVKPGQVDLNILPQLDLSAVRRCLYRVEANVGAGWSTICPLGDCSMITGTLGPSTTQVWQVRVSGDNGLVSEPVSKTLVADSIAPTAQISPTVILSGDLAFIRGRAWDTFPDTRTPHRVELSINGGRFRPAIVSPGGDQVVRNANPTAAASLAGWFFPLQVSHSDGETVQVVARAIDQAGNVGVSSDPVVVTLDGAGPVITGTVNEDMLEGTVVDGSGVASVEVSLDGGAHYRSATVVGDNWSYDMMSWVDGQQKSFAMLRAYDVWGNVGHEVVVVDPGFGFRLLMPIFLVD